MVVATTPSSCEQYALVAAIATVQERSAIAIDATIEVPVKRGWMDSDQIRLSYYNIENQFQGVSISYNEAHHQIILQYKYYYQHKFKTWVKASTNRNFRRSSKHRKPRMIRDKPKSSKIEKARESSKRKRTSLIKPSMSQTW
ncbi:hypothetical protein FGO68_gene6499 [Halteria grandinella]|uniref:Uncharacterized protein n=1 Tax=Halteria grandinella TaxID=5974 RepID=A0A8J8T9U5_HALGN|nr:hypothetical protein FGO68_gene6499 [Halteria grandinella]